jgi:hypothetical protein
MKLFSVLITFYCYRMQHELEVTTKQAIFVDSSISDTIRTCIVLGNHRAAVKVKTEFKVCSSSNASQGKKGVNLVPHSMIFVEKTKIEVPKHIHWVRRGLRIAAFIIVHGPPICSIRCNLSF